MNIHLPKLGTMAERVAVAISYLIVGTMAGVAVFAYVACIFHG